MALLTGIGLPSFETYKPNTDLLIPINPITFEINGESESIQSRRYNDDGFIVIAGSRTTSKEYTLTLGIEAVDWASLEFSLGKRSTTVVNRVLARLRRGVVPATAPYEISDPTITAANVANGKILASISARYVGGPMAYLAESSSSTPGPGEYYVDTANNKLIFNAAQARAPIAYRVKQTYATMQNIGYDPNAIALDDVAFSGIAFGDEFVSKGVLISIPRMTRSSIPSLSLSEVTTLTVDFKLVEQPGEGAPFYIDEIPD